MGKEKQLPEDVLEALHWYSLPRPSYEMQQRLIRRGLIDPSGNPTDKGLFALEARKAQK